MSRFGAKKKAMVAAACFAAIFSLWPTQGSAHCDSKDGPVATDAREALKKGEFEEVAIWVGKEQHQELRAAYRDAIAVYKDKNADAKAKKLAQRFFVETAVRLHRRAEGMHYTGLKPPGPLPVDIARAEKALETGNIEPVFELLGKEMRKKVRHLFAQVRAAQKNKDKNLKAGRKWADLYVKYVIFVHGLYQTIQAGPAHGVGE